MFVIFSGVSEKSKSEKTCYYLHTPKARDGIIVLIKKT